MAHKRWLGRVGLVAGLLALGCGGGAAAGGGPGSPDDSEESAGESGDGEAGEGSAASSAATPAPEVGAVAEEKRALSMEVTLRLRKEGRDAGISAKKWAFEEGRKLAIEKANNRAVTELNVIYGIREGKGLENWTPLPTEGKGYSVRFEGGSLSVLDPDGQAVSSAEADVALAEYGYLGKPHPLLVQVIAPAPEVGAKLVLDKAAALALMGYMPEMEFGEVTAVYQGTEDRGGRPGVALEVALQGKITEGKAIYELDLSGKVHLDRKTGWVSSLDLSGKVKPSGEMTVKDKTLKIDGQGQVTLTREATIK